MAVYFFVPVSWTNAVWYGVRFQVDPAKVGTDPKPKDCDFMHSPLGDKGCNYKIQVKAYNAAGTPVAGDDVPKYGLDTKTSKPIISFNDGKTWEWYWEATIPDRTIESVRAVWVREKTD